ncbi:hypothetical protein MMC21_003151 [Puttea exsequens]|nr:hypothetical protein [Puttea exsequens]
MSTQNALKITLIGAGTIGLSFAALHLEQASKRRDLRLHITIHDSRTDIEEHISTTLPKYLSCTLIPVAKDGGKKSFRAETDTGAHECNITIDDDLSSAVSEADIVQEQGPENTPFKTALWPSIEQHCPPSALLWSSTSGIPASIQSANMKNPSRLVVVHPYNPPHIMPLLEIVPSPITSSETISRTLAFWEERGRKPIVLKKEVTGFVANRLAFALLREAIHLVDSGVASAMEIDRLMTSSMGPRWAVAGVFKSFHTGGGTGGLEGFFKNIGGTVQTCWDDNGEINVGEGWEATIFEQVKDAYGVVDTNDRDTRTKKVLEAVKD